jgi:mannose-1-phosphate guanylyltransferase/mannose-6-phosphate isomerase
VTPWLIVLAGGSGTRFWPRSRSQLPKQLLSIVGDESLLVTTLRRFSDWIPANQMLVVTTADLKHPVELALKNLPCVHILVEPSARNTAPAITMSMEWIYARDPEASCIVVPADHWIPDTKEYIATMKQAHLVALEQGLLVTIGIPPTRPETGFGYIRSGDSIGSNCLSVDRFVEKPSKEVAETMVQQPEYLWNAGMFVWTLTSFFKQMSLCSPDMLSVLAPYRAALKNGQDGTQQLDSSYPSATATSIDYALMEKSKAVAVVPGANFTWNDLGSFVALEEVFARTEGGVARADRVLAIDSLANIIDCPNKTVALLGVTDMILVDTGDVILLATKERAQEVKRFVERLKQEGRKDLV